MFALSLTVGVFPGKFWIGVLAFAIVLGLVLWLAGQRFSRGSKPSSLVDPSLVIDLANLKVGGPPATGPRLEYYGTPVRLVVLVLAPSGRGTQVPEPSRLRAVFDSLIPGLAQVLDHHQPQFHRWPEQFSAQGFAQAFSTHIELPGDKGKGTSWCSVAGRFSIGEGHLLAGLICRAAKPNSLGQFVVQHEGMWHDVLRVRQAND